MDTHYGILFGMVIKIISHDQALKSNLTNVDCMEYGPNQIYPPVKKGYNYRIELQGGVAYEFTTAETSERKHFLICNHIVLDCPTL